MPDYKRRSLGDVADIIMGQSPAGETCNRHGEGYPLLNGPTEFGQYHPIPTQYTTDGRKFSSVKDILFCVRGSTTGRMNWSDQIYAIGRGIAAVHHRRDSKAQPLVRAVLEFNLEALLLSATGSTFPNVSAAQLASIPYPELSHQDEQAIAAILGALDDKIDLNRRMNETLEAMARAIFKDWFVDFGPTRAKMEGRAPYLAQEIWDLFPDRLDEEGKPEGWLQKHLAEVSTKITKGTTPTSDMLANTAEPYDKVNFIKVNALNDSGQLAWNKLETIPKSIHMKELSRSVLQEGDILYSIAGTIGRVFVVNKEVLPANTNQALAIIRPNTREVPTSLLLLLLSSSHFQEDLHANIVQAVQANISLSMISSRKYIAPPQSELKRLFIPIDPLFERVASNNLESRILAQTRDLLLPKLMSGEIRVKDAEKSVEAVL